MPSMKPSTAASSLALSLAVATLAGGAAAAGARGASRLQPATSAAVAAAHRVMRRIGRMQTAPWQGLSRVGSVVVECNLFRVRGADHPGSGADVALATRPPGPASEGLAVPARQPAGDTAPSHGARVRHDDQTMDYRVWHAAGGGRPGRDASRPRGQRRRRRRGDPPGDGAAGRGVRKGYRGILDSYRKHYATAQQMGRLTFSELDVRLLPDAGGEPRYAVVTGRFHLDRATHGEVAQDDGVFSLLWEKTADGWKIILD